MLEPSHASHSSWSLLQPCASAHSIHRCTITGTLRTVLYCSKIYFESKNRFFLLRLFQYLCISLTRHCKVEAMRKMVGNLSSLTRDLQGLVSAAAVTWLHEFSPELLLVGTCIQLCSNSPGKTPVPRWILCPSHTRRGCAHPP